MSSLVGRIIPRYQIIDEISRGGMGVVYRAVDVRLNREVALKVLPPDLVADADRRQRFVQEARAASSLEHPNIAVIHEIDDVDGISFIAMELVRGEQLSNLTSRQRSRRSLPGYARQRRRSARGTATARVDDRESGGVVHRLARHAARTDARPAMGVRRCRSYKRFVQCWGDGDIDANGSLRPERKLGNRVTGNRVMDW